VSDSTDIQDRECFGKRRYATMLEAQVTANKRSERAGRPLRVYACPHCGGAHISKSRIYRGPSAY
jgi:hypothetical protein